MGIEIITDGQTFLKIDQDRRRDRAGVYSQSIFVMKLGSIVILATLLVAR